MKTHCPCGYEFADGMTYCPYCGQKRTRTTKDLRMNNIVHLREGYRNAIEDIYKLVVKSRIEWRRDSGEDTVDGVHQGIINELDKLKARYKK